MEMNDYSFCDWLKIYKLYKKDNGWEEWIVDMKKLFVTGLSYYHHSYLGKFVQYSDAEALSWRVMCFKD